MQELTLSHHRLHLLYYLSQDVLHARPLSSQLFLLELRCFVEVHGLVRMVIHPLAADAHGLVTGDAEKLQLQLNMDRTKQISLLRPLQAVRTDVKVALKGGHSSRGQRGLLVTGWTGKGWVVAVTVGPVLDTAGTKGVIAREELGILVDLQTHATGKVV